MKEPTELEAIKRERDIDTEWLMKYKRIIVGLMTIAEIQADACNNDIDEWAAVYHGLQALTELIQGDIDGRKEAK